MHRKRSDIIAVQGAIGIIGNDVECRVVRVVTVLRVIGTSGTACRLRLPEDTVTVTSRSKTTGTA